MFPGGLSFYQDSIQDKPAVGIFSTRFGELAIGSAGLTQRAAKDINISFCSINVPP